MKNPIQLTLQKAQSFTILAKAQSQSNPSHFYEIRIGADNVTYCTCPAWAFSKVRHNCKHLDSFKMSLRQAA